MFCNNCGTQIQDGTVFCPNCGAQVGAAQPAQQPVQPAQPVQPVQQPVYAQPVYAQPAQPVQQAEADSTPILVMGIIAIATCGLGLLGIIFGAIGKKKAKAYQAAYGPLTGKAKVGSILSKIGLIIGIIMTIVWIIDIIVIIAAAATGALSSGIANELNEFGDLSEFYFE